jgi:TM2 domain-containing membrane protein YozV
VTFPESPVMTTKFCHACGNKIDVTANMCRYCGAMQVATTSGTAVATSGQTDRRILPAFLLCVFLGVFGAHRFYVGKKGTAVLQLLTLGGLGIWAFVDLILIATGSFRDFRGEKITEWS